MVIVINKFMLIVLEVVLASLELVLVLDPWRTAAEFIVKMSSQVIQARFMGRREIILHDFQLLRSSKSRKIFAPLF